MGRFGGWVVVMIDCPDAATLQKLEAGELGDDEAERVWPHVEECPTCAGRLEGLRGSNLDTRVIRAALRDEVSSDVPVEKQSASVASTLVLDEGLETVSPTKTVGGAVSFGDTSRSTDWSIPDYERVRLCGEGAFGTVWAVCDRVGMHRALKTIDLSRLKNANVECRESTALEAYCRRVRRHRNLIQIFHVGVQGSLLYYTMELADDAVSRKTVRDTMPAKYRPLSLHTVLGKGKVGVTTAMEVALRLLRGLSRLHETGMAHRDIKPANIVFVDREVKLADIGMLTTNTATPSQVGTPAYMPPDRQMDLTGDVFAMGRVLFELLVGYEVETFPTLPETVDRGEASGAGWDLDRVERVIGIACADHAVGRYANAEQMLEELEACRDLTLASLFSDLGAVEQPVRRETSVDDTTARVLVAVVNVLPWVLGLILAIVVAQKLL